MLVLLESLNYEARTGRRSRWVLIYGLEPSQGFRFHSLFGRAPNFYVTLWAIYLCGHSLGLDALRPLQDISLDN